VPGLQPGPGDPVRARHRGTALACLLFLPRCPQVEVVLQQLPQYLPSPLVQKFLQLAGRQAGRGRAGELGGQPAGQGLRRGALP
jgi:hypothetical protein